jgi:uncharacterized protein (DUF488 family)
MDMNLASAGPGLTVYTIGHSNHELEVFFGLLAAARIQTVADVRSHPFSRYATQFDRDRLPEALRQRGIEYLFLGEQVGGKPESGEFYDDEGHVRYDRLAGSPAFGQGLAVILDGIKARRLALMCSEEDPAECHRRRLIGRVLAARGVAVVHLRGDGRIQTEDDLAAEEQRARTRGQLSLFDLEEEQAWRSTRSASPKKARRSFSNSSGGEESNA